MTSLSTQTLEHYSDHSSLAGIQNSHGGCNKAIDIKNSDDKISGMTKAAIETVKRGEIRDQYQMTVDSKVMKVYQKWGSNDKMYN